MNTPLSNDVLQRLAAANPPPQSWWDEDFEGLFHERTTYHANTATSTTTINMPSLASRLAALPESPYAGVSAVLVYAPTWGRMKAELLRDMPMHEAMRSVPDSIMGAPVYTFRTYTEFLGVLHQISDAGKKVCLVECPTGAEMLQRWQESRRREAGNRD